MRPAARIFALLFGLLLAAGSAVQSARAQAPGGDGERSVLLAPDPAIPQIPLYVDDPEDAALRPAVSAMRENDWARAIDELDAVLEEDPDHLEAHYYRGIAYRERAKLRTVLSRMFDNWEKGIDEFRRVIERDSSYRDVLHQLALYSRVQSRFTDLRGLDENVEYTEAITLQHAQVRLRPERPQHLFHLYAFYRRYLRHTDPSDAIAWLDERTSEFDRFARAEAMRRDGRLEAADRRLARLLEEELRTLPPQAPLLARARIHFAGERPERAQTFVEEAIARIDGPVDAAFLFEDVKYVITPQELVRYRRADDADAYRRFFRAVWARRDPMPARSMNVRLREHYERLLVAEEDYVFDGFRLWRNNPDRLEQLSFPAPYHLNGEFNDKGLIYIRHGEPDDRVVTLEGAGSLDSFRGYLGSRQSLPTSKQNSPLASWRPNESWRYTYRTMEFHFVIAEGGTGNNWRLTPTLTNVNLLRDREHWGGIYLRMTRAADRALATLGEGGGVPSSDVMSFTQDREDMATRSVAHVRRGLTTDRHTWPAEVTPVEFSYLVAPFRGPADSSMLFVAYGLDGREILGDRASEAPASVESGLALHGSSWEQAFGRTRRDSLEEGDQRVLYRATVAPDSYRVSMHVRTLEDARIGDYQTRIEVPDFSTGSPSMSGLLPARSVTEPSDSGPAGGPATVRRGDRLIDLDPSARFEIGGTAHVYFELYHLGLDEEDRTRYRVTYRLEEEGEEPGFFGRLFGSDEPRTVTLETRRRGTDPSPAEYAQLDLQEVPPGAYRLTVRVRDQVTDLVLERSRPVTLVDP